MNRANSLEVSVKILPIDCTPDHIERLKSILASEKHIFEGAVQCESGYSCIFEDEHQPRVILIDEQSAHLEEIAKLVREARVRNDLLYMIVIINDAASVSEHRWVAEADDVLFSLGDAAEPRLRFAIAERTLSERAALLKQLTYDPVSGALNEHAVEKAFYESFERSRRDVKAMSVIIVELDDFKEIRMRAGNNTVNKIVHDVAEALKRKVRRYDAIGRFRDDSFIVILGNCTSIVALGIARRIKRETKDVLGYTASIGVAGWTPGQRVSSEMILSEAFNALNLARIKGRDSIEIVDWMM